MRTLIITIPIYTEISSKNTSKSISKNASRNICRQYSDFAYAFTCRFINRNIATKRLTLAITIFF